MIRPAGKTFVFVTWRDSQGDPNGMCEAEMPHEPMIVTSAGWLMRDDDEGVSLFSEWISNETGRNYEFILRELITEIYEVRIPNAKPRRSKELSREDASESDGAHREEGIGLQPGSTASGGHAIQPESLRVVRRYRLGGDGYLSPVD